MKNKILPLSLVTLVILLGAFLISATVTIPESILNRTDDSELQKSVYSTHIAKMRANQHTGVVDNADVIKARQQALENTTRGIGEDFEWKFLGPDNVGGFTEAILFDSRDEAVQTIIAGASTGGLYKSTNTGLTWTKINGIESNLFVNNIDQASDGTIFLSTGGTFMGSGIYKSTDGENFELLPSTDPTTNSAFAQTQDLEINPSNGDIFVATWLGILYSSDQGATWNLARADTAFLTGASYDVEIGTNGITAVEMDGLCYISETGHPNQFMLHSGDTFNLPSEDADFLKLAISPSNPDILYGIILEESGEEYELTGIYRSDNKGVNWRLIAPGGSATLNMTFSPINCEMEVFPANPDKVLVGGADTWEGTKYDETGYFQWLRRSNGVLPPQVGADVVHTWHREYVFRPGYDNEFYVGSNGGINKGVSGSVNYEFTDLNKTYITSQAMTIGFGGTEKLVLGGFDQAGVQLIDGYGNPAQARNGTQLIVGGPYWGGNGSAVFLSQIDPLVAIYSSAGGVFVRDEELGANPSASFLGGGMDFPDDYLAPALFWENVDNELSRDTLEIIVTNTIPAGTDMWLFNPRNRGYPVAYTADQTYYEGDTMFVWNPVNTKFFIGTEDEVWMTQDVIDFTATPTWFLISNDDTGLEGLVSCLAMSADANFVYAGTEEGSVYRIANIGLAYNYERADVRSPYCTISTAEILTTDENDQMVTSIAVDPQDPNRIVVTLGNYGNESYVLRCTDALGANPSFTSIQGNLPQMPVHASLIEMNNDNMCIIGTEMGVYETQNFGAASPTWNASFGIAGQAPVFELKQQITAQEEISIWFWDGVDSTQVIYPGTKNYGNIYAATYGRGLYYSNKYRKPVGIIQHDAPEYLSNVKVFPNPVRSNATIEYKLETSSSVMLTVFDINGKMVATENITQDQGTHQYQLDCSALPRGMYVISVQAGNTVQTSKFVVSH